MAEGLPDDGKLYCLEKNEQYADLAWQHWQRAGVDHKIELKIGLALETLDEMNLNAGLMGSLDFAFVDGDKHLY